MKYRIFYISILCITFNYRVHATDYSTVIAQIKSIVLPDEETIRVLKERLEAEYDKTIDPMTEAGKVYSEQIFDQILKLQIAEARRLGVEREFIEKVNRIAINDRSFHSWLIGSHNSKGDVKIVIPEKYTRTPMDFRTRLHELTHTLQELATKGDYRQYYRAMLPSTLDEISMTLYSERQAMSWEWTMIHVLPGSFRKHYLAQVRTDLNLDSRGEWIRWILNSSSDRRDYIKNEWKSGRYSPRMYRSMIYENNKNKLLMAACGAIALISTIVNFLP